MYDDKRQPDWAAVFFSMLAAICVTSGMVIGSKVAVHYFRRAMEQFFRHIVSISLALLTVALVVATVPSVHAENDKRSSSPKITTRSSSLSPMTRAVSTALRTLTSRKAAADDRSQVKVASGRDSAVSAPRIISTRVASEVFTARIEMASDEPLVDIAIFNMLGKRVMEVYKGSSSRGVHEHTQSVSDLPEGVYMCVLQGSNFRKAEKFFFSR